MRSLTLCLVLLWPSLATAEWYREDREMMGTAVTVELWSADATLGRATLERAMEALHGVDLMMNPWDPASELARINREAAAAPVAVSEDIYRVFERGLYYSRLSGGAFDISFASVGQFYDYRAGEAPSDAVVAENRMRIDYRAIVLDPDKHTIFYAIDGLQVDLGGIAKGFAVDKAIDVLLEAGIVAGFASAGGDSRILGDHGDRPRMIGIKHPRKPGEFAVMIPLADTAISTSGDYERYFERDGVRFHHILDPQTGRSSGNAQSVSILAPRAIDSDALSTTTFVLGVERGLALIDSLPGVDAIIIDAAGKLHYSADLLRAAAGD